MGNGLSERIRTKVIQVDPRTIKLLEINARYMRRETFARLVENVQADGALTQIPFAWQLHDDATREPQFDAEGDPIWEVLSGNHRVKGAIAAGIELIDLQVTEQYLEPSRRRAIQLSHNAITGEDDPATLKLIYDEIDDVEMRIYAGLDDKQLQLIDDVKVEGLSEANLTFQTIAMTFLPAEVESIGDVWEVAKKELKGRKETWLAHLDTYDQALDAIEAASAASGVRNVATALIAVLEIFTRHIGDLRDLYLDADGEAVDGKRDVPIDSVIGDIFIPAATAAKLNKVVERLIGEQRIESDRRWEALDVLTEQFLGGQN